MTTQIIWNGHDTYIEVEALRLSGDYEYTELADGSFKLFQGPHEFTSFDVVEVSEADVPLDAEGEKDFSGLFGTEAGKIYREAD